MRYLLDTHTLLWFLFDDKQLSKQVIEVIEREDKLYLSIASLWEIAIKQSIGKLNINKTILQIEEQCNAFNIDIISIKPIHCEKIKELDRIHNDPFDRILISQALIEDMTLLTKDGNIVKYNVKTLW
ncbi:MAG: type II toxin-antitoxin system VapC family toxin [Lachnospiraceae bacterium]|nr:type II toxin-antitoxin system VapC family toxin [Lachnospiraceae bacterium]